MKEIFPSRQLVCTRLGALMPFILLIFLSSCLLFPALAEETPEWKQDYIPDEPLSGEQHLRFANGAEPKTLDPHIMTGVTESTIARALFEGLTHLDPMTLEPRPGAAQTWEISDNGLQYTFHLRKNVKWSNGVALTAHDFVQSWKRILNPLTASEYAYMLFYIAGAENYLTGKTTDFTTVGVHAENDHTLYVRLHQPCPWFLELTALSSFYPVYIPAIEQHEDRWTHPENIVSNGPFQLEEWAPNERIILTPSVHYWDHAFVKLKRITIFPYDNADAAYDQFTLGELDWITTIPQSRIDEIRKHPDYFARPYMGTYYYRFNCSKPPMNNPLVRKALSMSIDRSIITTYVTKAGQIPATWFCPAVGGYKHVDGLSYNPEQAKVLLAEAGYADPSSLTGLEILYNTSDNHKQVAENIIQQWKDTLGITVSLINLDWKVYLGRMSSLDYSIARSGWIGDYNDPNTFFDTMVSGGGNNRTGWSNATYDKLLAQSQAEQDHSKRLDIFRQMEQILVCEEVPVLPIYIYVYQGMLSERVIGFEHNIRDIHPFQYMWIEE